MASFNIEDRYLSIVRNAEKLRSSFSHISKRLKDNNYIEPTNNNMCGAIRKLVDQEVIGEFPVVEIENYLINASAWTNDLVEFHQRKEEDDYFVISRQKGARRAERIDFWVLWIQRLIRWVLSVFLIVFIYSVLVWISDSVNFIKIPLRDLAFKNTPSVVQTRLQDNNEVLGNLSCLKPLGGSRPSTYILSNCTNNSVSAQVMPIYSKSFIITLV